MADPSGSKNAAAIASRRSLANSCLRFHPVHFFPLISPFPLDAAGMEAERSLHLTDHEFTVTDGKNTQAVEYRNLKRYFRCRDLLFLLAGSNLLYGVIQLDRLPDRGAELISRLHADKVGELKFWSFGRWWRMVALMAVIFLFILGIIYFTAYPGITKY